MSPAAWRSRPTRTPASSPTAPKSATGLRAIATVYPNPQWFVVIDDSIQSIHDLKGKRAFVEMQGSNGEAW